MLLTVCLALAALSVVVTLRWSVARVDSIGRARPFPALSVGIPAVAAMVAAVPLIRHAQLESRLADVAGTLAGHSVQVRCETLGQAWLEAHPERGYVRFGADGVPEPRAVITYDTCRDLAAWIGSDHASSDLDQVISVHVLTHESMHLRAIADEARAECAALQRDYRTATALGATDAEARALVARYLAEVYPRMPDAYRSGGCVAGGELDEHLEISPWA